MSTMPSEVPNKKTNNLPVAEPCEQGKPKAVQVQHQVVSSFDMPSRTAAIVGELRRKDNL